MQRYRMGNFGMWILVLLMLAYGIWNEERMSRERMALYTRIVEVQNEARLLSDEHGIILDATPSAVALFGYPLAELIGSPISVLMPEDYKKRHESKYALSFKRTQTMGPITIPAEVVRKDRSKAKVYITVRIATIDGRRLALALFSKRT